MRWISPRIQMTIGLLGIVMLVYWLGTTLHGRSVPTREAAELESRISICESLAVTSALLIQETQSLPQDYINQMMARNPKFRSIGIRNPAGKLVVSTANHKSAWADPDLSDKDRFQPELFIDKRRSGQIEFTFEAKTPAWISSDLFRDIFLLCGTAFGFMLYLGRMMNVMRPPPKSMPNEFQSALDILDGGLMVLNKSGKIVIANESFALSCGCNVKDVVGKQPEKVSRWLTDDGKPLKNPPWKRAIKTGERVYEDVVRMVVSDNSTGIKDTLTFKVNCAPVKSHSSNGNGVLVSLVNVTELAKSKLPAEDANTAKSDSLANMSHEIRTPVNDISAMNEISVPSKIEAEKPEIDRIQENPDRIVNDVASPLSIGAKAKGVEQTTEFKNELPASVSTNLTGGTVLVVDDGDANRRLVNLVLTKAGLVVTEAVNGKTGSDLALQCDFDLILMDMQMPVMDGYTATGRLRKNGYKGPIVALTANAMSGDRKICLAVGCDDFVAKPVNIDLLKKTVAKYVSLSTKASQATQANKPVKAQQTQETAKFAAASNLVENQTSPSVEVS